MKFKTQFDEHDRVFSDPGSPERIEYRGYYNEKGDVELEAIGKTNIYDEIQSHADSVDIKCIMNKYRCGDLEVLNKVKGFYADVTDMPKNFREFLNIAIDAEAHFNELPVDIKEKFGNSFQKYLISVGSQDWFDNLGFRSDEIIDKSSDVNDNDRKEDA